LLTAGIEGVDEGNVLALSQYFSALTPAQQSAALTDANSFRAMVGTFESQSHSAGLSVFENLSADYTAAKTTLGVVASQNYVPLNATGGDSNNQLGLQQRLRLALESNQPGAIRCNCN